MAQIASGVTTYLAADHLNTPRIGTNSLGALVWRWDGAAFGESPPIVQGATVNLRFPGQYFDAETGLHQNWNRDYLPANGRYLESDLIGLNGGVNTYSYAGGNPLQFTDPTGEFINLPGIAIGVGIEVAMQAYKNYSDGCDLLDIDKYELWNIGIAGAVGAFAPRYGNNRCREWRIR